MKALRTYAPPNDTEKEFVLHILERQFRNVVTPIPSGWDSRRNFDTVLMHLEKQSSPGWPLCREKPTIGEWLFGPDLFPIKQQAEKLWSMVQSVFDGTYTHVYKIFIKAEPHTQRKIMEKRWRLIMMSSLPVQVAWHMLLEHLTKPMLCPFATPLAHGLVYFGGGWKIFHHYLKQNRLNWTADKTGWDWNSPGWVYDVSKELLRNLSSDVQRSTTSSPADSINSRQKWDSVLDNLFSDAFENKRVIMPDNTILQQNSRGLMPSGCVWTIQLNGIAQVALHILALHRIGVKPSSCRILATGDDTIQEMPPGLDTGKYIQELQRCGCVIKECGFGSDFMGFEILSTGFYPKYADKHFENFRIQKSEYLQETIEGYLRIYCHDNLMFDFWKTVAHRLGFRMPSRTYFLYFANHPDALEEFSFARPSFGDRQASVDVVV